MNEKIMGLIELAMKFKSEIAANVDFGSHTNGVTVWIFEDGEVTYRKVCYLEYVDAGERLDRMKKDLEEMLKAKAA